jgi:hypothetical protein
MKSIYKCLLVIMALVMVTGCAQKQDRIGLVYATTYALLTETADAAARLPLPESESAGSSDGSLQATLTPIVDVTSTDTETPSATVVEIPASPVTPTNTIDAFLQSTPSSILPTNTFQPGGYLPILATDTPRTGPFATLRPTSTLVNQPPTQGLVGLWQEYPTGWVIQFNADMSYYLGPSYRYLVSQTVDQGIYTLSDGQLTLSSSVASVSCKSTIGVYQIQISSSNQRLFNLVQDPCYDRQRALAAKTWYWLPVQPGTVPAVPSAAEWPLEILTFTGPVASADAQITGLAWFGDKLVFLPQYPDFVDDGKSYLFAVPRDQITEAIRNTFASPLSPQQILLIDAGVIAQLRGFVGYQALAISGNDVYLIAQADPGSGLKNYLVAGSIASDLSTITMDASRVVEIPAQGINLESSYLSLMISNETLLVLPDLNGWEINPTPVAERFNRTLSFLGFTPINNLDFLVTDAAEVDANGLFWVINKNAPGDLGEIYYMDPLAQLYGEGVTHQVFNYLERLVAFQLTSNALNLAALPPMQFELSAKGARNWQGLAKIGDQGYLMVASDPSGTILGYLERP